MLFLHLINIFKKSFWYSSINSSFKYPILFLTYKRFETSIQVFESIKKAKPKKLYFASNAPKNNDTIEIEKVVKVRSLVDLIDWDCEIITLFRDVHLDVKESITFTIDWFFSMEEKGIIGVADNPPCDTIDTFPAKYLFYFY